MGKSKKQRWKIKNSKGFSEGDEQEMIKATTAAHGTCWHKALKYHVQSWLEENCISRFWIGHVYKIISKWRNRNSFHGNSSLCGEGNERTLWIQDKWFNQLVQEWLSNVGANRQRTILSSSQQSSC